MKYLIYIMLLFLIACTGTRELNKDYSIFYNIRPEGPIYPLFELVDEHNRDYLKTSKAKGVTIDIEQLTYLHYPDLKDKLLETLRKCDDTEYVYIKYPSGFMTEDFSFELSSAFAEMDALKRIDIGLDSANSIPLIIPENGKIEELRVAANYIKEISDDTSMNSLKFLGITCMTNDLNMDWSNLKGLIALNLHLKGNIDAPLFDNSNKLHHLSFTNDRIDSLPDEFFCLPEIESMLLSFPRLKAINKRIGELTTLGSLYIGCYEINELPDAFSQLEALTSLSIGASDNVKSIQPLVDLPQLKSLSIGGINVLDVVDDIILMKKLDDLSFGLKPLYHENLSVLAPLKKIKNIRFSIQYVEKVDGVYITKSIEKSEKNEIYEQLNKVLPNHFPK